MADNQNDDVRALAARHGIDMRGPIEFNEQGLDFRIAFVQDAHGHRWVLRIPRRADVYAKILYEAKVLDFVKTQLSVKVPDWRVVRPELVAYPLIEDKTALTFDPVTFEVRWNIECHRIGSSKHSGRRWRSCTVRPQAERLPTESSP